MLPLLEPDHSCATELARRLFALSSSSRRDGRPLALIGQHPSLVDVQQRLLRFAEADAPVLIQGETGTGKELFARALHLLSSRQAETYVSINCAQHQDGCQSASCSDIVKAVSLAHPRTTLASSKLLTAARYFWTK
jgi:transcriptional regulator with AAA-type ATPase domain